MKQAYNDIISGKVGISFGIGGELSANSQKSEAWYQNLSKDQKETFNKTFNESLSNEIGKSRNASASFSNLLKTGNVTNSASIKSSMDSYRLNNSVGYDRGSTIYSRLYQ